MFCGEFTYIFVFLSTKIQDLEGEVEQQQSLMKHKGERGVTKSLKDTTGKLNEARAALTSVELKKSQTQEKLDDTQKALALKEGKLNTRKVQFAEEKGGSAASRKKGKK